MRRADGPGWRALAHRIPLVETLRSYRWELFRADLPAALTVALFAVPQAMAFALVAGVPPVHGLYTAIVACMVGAAMGSSPYLVDGPTNTMSVMLAADVALASGRADPVSVVLTITLFAGVFQLLMGLLKLGSISRFVSTPVLHGFTAGAGVYIVANQLHSLLGFTERPPPPVVGGVQLESTCVVRVWTVLTHLELTNPAALGLGLGTFAVIRLLRSYERRSGRRLPSTLLGIAAGTLASELLGLGSEAAGVHRVQVVEDLQPIARALPSFRAPDLLVLPPTDLLGPALALALLGAIEAIAIGRSLADRSGTDFDPNQQLVGEGSANFAVSLFGGFASSGSFTRSAVNFEAGAATRLSGFMAGLFVLALVLLLAPVANRIPVPVLAGSLMHAATILVNVGKLRLSLVTTRGDRLGLVVTFLGVLLVSHLEQALLLGIAVSLGIALRRAHRLQFRRLLRTADGHFEERSIEGTEDCPVCVLEVSGELFFAAVDRFVSTLRPFTRGRGRVLVLRLRNAANLDSTICEALLRIGRALHASGSRLLLAGVPPATLATLRRAGVVDLLGEEAIFPMDSQVYASTSRALDAALEMLPRLAAEAEAGGAGEG